MAWRGEGKNGFKAGRIFRADGFDGFREGREGDLADQEVFSGDYTE